MEIFINYVNHDHDLKKFNFLNLEVFATKLMMFMNFIILNAQFLKYVAVIK